MLYFEEEYKERNRKKWEPFFPKKKDLLKGKKNGFLVVLEDAFFYNIKRMKWERKPKENYIRPPSFHKVIVKCINCGKVFIIPAHSFKYGAKKTCGSYSCRCEYVKTFADKGKLVDRYKKDVLEARKRQYDNREKTIMFLIAEMNKLKLQAFGEEDEKLVAKYKQAIDFLNSMSISKYTHFTHCPLCGTKLLPSRSTIVNFKSFSNIEKKVRRRIGDKITVSICPKCFFVWAELLLDKDNLPKYKEEE